MSTSVTSVTSHFPQAQNGFVTTTSGSVAQGAPTVGLNSTSGYTNGMPVAFVIDPTDSTKKQTFTGIMDTSGNQVTAVKWTAGTDQAHAAGATVVDFATATHIDMISKGILKEHNQDGTHGNVNTEDLSVGGTFKVTGQNDGWVLVSGIWTYSSYDSATATGVITVPSDAATQYTAGMRIRITNSGTQYGIITKVLSTALTVYFGTDYSLTNTAITAPAYSPHKGPYGFPVDPTKWTQTATDTSSRTQSSPSAGTWYNLGNVSLAIPIGVWNVIYQVMAFQNNGVSENQTFVTLSTANNSESDTGFTGQVDGSGLSVIGTTLHMSKLINLASSTTYYLNTKAQNASATSIANKNNEIPLFIRATCALL